MNKIYSNMNKIYRNAHVNIQKSTTLQEDPGTLQRCSRRCGRLKQCFSRKRPSPSISSSSSVAALHVCRSASSVVCPVQNSLDSVRLVPGSRRVSGGSSIQPSRGSIWTVSGMFSTSWLKTSGTSAVDTRASIMRRLT